MKLKRKRWQKVVELIFHGERFQGHGLDTAALKDIVIFQEIVAETAKIIWRRNNPQRKRLLRGFEELITLRLTEIKSGSAAVPLELPLIADEQRDFWEGPLNEAVEAVEKTYETIYAASFKKPIPTDTPKEILPLYNEFGKTLGPREAVFISMMKRGRKKAKFDNNARRRITRYIAPEYEDTAEITGTVLAADIKRGIFVIYPNLYRGLPVTLPKGAEKKVTTALRDHENVQLKVKGKGKFSPIGELLKISEASEIVTAVGAERTYDTKAKPIWEVIKDIGETIPAEDLEKIPRDASKRLDYYLYGTKGK